jgi:hypothetical protein
METLSEKMPTELIKRKKNRAVVSKRKYDELHKLYDEVVELGYDLLDMIDERDEIIDDLEEENTELRAIVECRFETTSTKPPRRGKKKFDGATVSFDPKTRSLGIGLRFKDAD